MLGDCFISAVFPTCNSHMMPDRVNQQATKDDLLVGTQKFPAEAVGFLGRNNPQHAFLRRGSKAVGPMS